MPTTVDSSRNIPLSVTAQARAFVSQLAITPSLASQHLFDTDQEYRMLIGTGRKFDVFLCRSNISDTHAYLRVVRGGNVRGVKVTEVEPGVYATGKLDSSPVIELPLPSNFR